MQTHGGCLSHQSASLTALCCFLPQAAGSNRSLILSPQLLYSSRPTDSNSAPRSAEALCAGLHPPHCRAHASSRQLSPTRYQLPLASSCSSQPFAQAQSKSPIYINLTFQKQRGDQVAPRCWQGSITNLQNASEVPGLSFPLRFLANSPPTSPLLQ